MARQSAKSSFARPILWLILWSATLAAGWLFSDLWRNLLVKAYEARRSRLDALKDVSTYTITSPKLQKQIDEAANSPAAPDE